MPVIEWTCPANNCGDTVEAQADGSDLPDGWRIVDVDAAEALCGDCSPRHELEDDRAAHEAEAYYDSLTSEQQDALADADPRD